VSARPPGVLPEASLVGDLVPSGRSLGHLGLDGRRATTGVGDPIPIRLGRLAADGTSWMIAGSGSISRPAVDQPRARRWLPRQGRDGRWCSSERT